MDDDRCCSPVDNTLLHRRQLLMMMMMICARGCNRISSYYRSLLARVSRLSLVEVAAVRLARSRCRIIRHRESEEDCAEAKKKKKKSE